ncbi:SOS response-associated peptidase [Marinoscillum sp. MHG1-6]|uniref:SOS response-associated peptidase n=1 Tax=Marinoscillum sp. MHG1-6 TaxID=2959627 RepID=UPI0021571DA0|nr:SOS response-associated peptidase [Marinoscillum sp. MHG1-6]
MCGRYGQTIHSIESWLDYRDMVLEDDVEFEDNYNVSHSNTTFILGYDELGKIRQLNASFGYRPYYGFEQDPKTKELIIDPESGYPKFNYKKARASINARAEGKSGRDKINEEDDPDYEGPFNIFRNSGFKSDALKHRCLIPVDYFIEGPEKERLDKPFLIERQDKRPFSLGGFYSDILGQRYMAIITTPAAKLLYEAVEHHRSPLVIPEELEGSWLNPEASTDELESMLKRFDSAEYLAIPLGKEIKAPNNTKKPNNHAQLITPAGEPILGHTI